MECPYCGAELIQSDIYGKTKYSEHYWIHPRSWIERTGDIYYCPNREGFDELEESLEYANKNDVTYESSEDIVCESGVFNGFFYTDKNDNLHEGYPC